MKPHKKVIELIQAGNATEADLIRGAELSGVKDLNLQFKVLREYFDLYPVLQQDDTYILLDEDAYKRRENLVKQQSERAKQLRKEAAEFKKLLEKDPQVKLNAAVKKREMALNKMNTATLKMHKSNDQLTVWKKERAQLDYRIADYELEQLKSKYMQFYKVDEKGLDELRNFDLLNERAKELLSSNGGQITTGGWRSVAICYLA